MSPREETWGEFLARSASEPPEDPNAEDLYRDKLDEEEEDEDESTSGGDS